MPELSNPPPWAGPAEPCLPPHLSRLWLRPDEAAELIRLLTGTPCSPRTLSTWRCRGGGPPFRKVRGRFVTYGRDDTMRWCAEGIGPAISSTSEVPND